MDQKYYVCVSVYGTRTADMQSKCFVKRTISRMKYFRVKMCTPAPPGNKFVVRSFLVTFCVTAEQPNENGLLHSVLRAFFARCKCVCQLVVYIHVPEQNTTARRPRRRRSPVASTTHTHPS